jgi:hypothetical protein
MPEEAMNWRMVMDRQAVAKASRMRRMELDNIAGRTSSKADLDEWAGGTQDYFFTQRADELRERAAQLKDFIAERQGRPYNVDFHITREALDDAIDGYLASGKYDNSMTEFIHGIKDRDLLLHNMNRYALGVVPPLATSRLDTYRKRK